MSEMPNITKRDLQRSDIHALRNLARSIGVSKPTSKKKDALVADIMAIVTGKQEPEYKNANRGRPAKNTDYYYPQGIIGLNLAVASKEKAYNPQTKYSGVVVVQSNGAKIKKLKFVDSMADVTISDSLLKKYKLKDNDIVDYELDDGKVKITKVNGKSLNQKLEKIDGKNFVFGATNLLRINSRSQKERIIEQIGGKVVVIPESVIDKYAGKDVTMLPMTSLDDAEILNGFFAGVSMASYYQKSGTNTTLVLSNYFNLLSCMQNTNGVANMQIEEYLTRFTSAGGTFVAFAPSVCEQTDDIKFDNVD